MQIREKLVLDEMLTDGYTTLDGTRINPDTGYLAYKAALPGAAKQTTPEAPAGGVDFGEYVQYQAREDVMFSQRDTSPEASTIREQLFLHKDELNNMDAVANKTVTLPDMRNKTSMVNWAMEQMADYGFEVERDDIGNISFEKKRIKTGIGYIHSGDAGRLAAFAALPEVLQDGIIIGRHSDHKGRRYETYTIAAPVVINDTRGNMAVTVIRTTGNYYRAHRILLPDGSGFVFVNKNDAASGTSGGVTDNGSLAQSAATASANSIRQNVPKVNPEEQFQQRDEQISVREMLANVIEDASTSADEMAWLRGYRNDLKELDRKLDAISQNKQIIRELMFKKGRTSEESQRLSKARERLKILNEQVARMDEGLKRDYRIDSVFLTALFECLRMYSMVSANTRVINNQQRHLYQMVQTPSG